jgi:hypothetical protein
MDVAIAFTEVTTYARQLHNLTQIIIFIKRPKFRFDILQEIKPYEYNPLNNLLTFTYLYTRGGHFKVKLNTTCETSLLPLYYMA